YNEYYPFGLQTANSWTRESATPNNYLYNAGNELNQTSGWYEMFYRGYDPTLGRMLQVDPMAHSYAGLTPYNYSFNDPIFWNDPNGADPIYMYGKLMNPRDGNGNESWEGSAMEYEIFDAALAGYGSTDGITIGG